MKPGGYMNRILFVDLSSQVMRDEEIDHDFARNYLGGYGFASKVLLERQRRGADPLGEESMLGILAGPLTGTSLPAVSRFTVAGKSPLTNSWGDANGSGFFGPAMKFSGYDALFLSGVSEKPVYMVLSNGKAEIRDAEDIWGLDTYRTEDILRQRHGKKIEVACIGPGGEKCSLLAGVVANKGRIAARSGLGAVMGAKRLKAVVALGGMKVPLADTQLVEDLRKKYTAQIKGGYGFADIYMATGTPGTVESGLLCGDSPVKNWYGAWEEDIKDTTEYRYENIEKYMTRKKTCYRCPIGCWAHVTNGDGPYALPEPCHRPEYETTSAFGSYLLNTDYRSIMKCNDLCNRYGLDTISVGSAVAFAMSCYEDGIITSADTEGIELNWGNHAAIVELTQKIVEREGFGEVLADGVMRAAQRIGRGSEKYAIHVGGQELPAHDPRHEPSMAAIYRLDATPGRHIQAACYVPPADLPELLPDIDFSLSFGSRRDTLEGRERAHRVLAALTHCVNSMGMCFFGFESTSAGFMHECYSAVTGWDVGLTELLRTGERIGTLRHVFALREGDNPVKRPFPEIALGKPPLAAGPLKGVTVDIDLLTGEFCREMDWDPETGIIGQKRLRELGLDWLYDELHRG